uniref:photosystem II protein Z n=1 Tax=Cephaleuros karstenii TaxID=1985640 RepID=UPI001EDD6977|nr:photosystem II protein Z [Cephaleuros karstenii]UIB39118.1 photosystem II protein Z [Cephaleuros karstenii]
MTFFQLLLFAFIVISFGLAVLIPVAFGNPDTWAKNKRLVFLGVSVWCGTFLTKNLIKL